MGVSWGGYRYLRWSSGSHGSSGTCRLLLGDFFYVAGARRDEMVVNLLGMESLFLHAPVSLRNFSLGAMSFSLHFAIALGTNKIRIKHWVQV